MQRPVTGDPIMAIWVVPREVLEGGSASAEAREPTTEAASATMAESLAPPPRQEDIALDDAFWDEEDWLADAEGEEWEIEAGFL